jgi:VanZ family protein
MTAVVVSLLAIVAATLTPMPASPSPRLPQCWYCDGFATTDVVVNVLLYVPIGVALRATGRRVAHVVGLGAVITLAVELLQLSVVPGRDASLRDAVANVLGALVGAALLHALPGAVRPTLEAARRLLRAWIAAALALVVFSCWAWTPSYPEGSYFGKWAPARGDAPVFRGRVVAAHAGGVPLAQGKYNDSMRIRDRLRASGNRISARFVPAVLPASRAPIIAVADERERIIVQMSLDGWAVSMELYQVADRLRLRKPSFRLENAVGPRAVPLVTGAYDHGRIRLTSTDTSRTVTHSFSLGPGKGWTLLVPFSHGLGAWSRVTDLVWVAVLVLPAAYYRGLARATHALPAFLVLAALFLTPALFDVATANLWELGGGLAGYVAGEALAALTHSERFAGNNVDAASV